MEESSQVIIRPAEAGEDHAFIYTSWRNALWFAKHPGCDKKPDTSFKQKTSDVFKKLFKEPDIDARIACLKEDPNMLLGWAVLKGEHLEFVYVKIDYRKKGIGKLLTKGFKTFSEPETKAGKRLKEKYGRKEKSQAQSS